LGSILTGWSKVIATSSRLDQGISSAWAPPPCTATPAAALPAPPAASACPNAAPHDDPPTYTWVTRGGAGSRSGMGTPLIENDVICWSAREAPVPPVKPT
jgi:hypothetical protein